MTEQTILKKAIEKATENGYKLTLPKEADYIPVFSIIFSHDFAKAFWGTTPHQMAVTSMGNIPYIEEWKFRLQKMVLEENPIKYLEQFIK